MKELIKYALKPLLLKDGSLYVSKGLNILVSKDDGETFKKIGRTNLSFFNKILAKFPLLARIGRLGFHYLDFNSFDTMIGVVRGHILVKEAKKDSFKVVFDIPRGSRLLNICITPNDDIYFGEYFSNKERNEVHIYKSSPPYKNWNVIHTFEAGEIRHVHRVYYDKYLKGIWVLTGDYGRESALWFTNDDFDVLTPVIRGGQKARAVAIIPTSKGVIGATDTQLEQNYIYFLDNNFKQELLMPISGPCFDIVKVGGVYFASSVIEVSDYNLGNYAILYGSIDGKKWIKIRGFIKDWYPKKWQLFFQFSVIQLVRSYQDNDRYLFLYCRGVKKYSSSLLRLEVAELKNLIQKKLSENQKNQTNNENT